MLNWMVVLMMVCGECMHASSDSDLKVTLSQQRDHILPLSTLQISGSVTCLKLPFTA